MNYPHVIKVSGEREAFDPVKLENSLRHAGAMEDMIDTICAQVISELYEDMPTRDIYRRAFSLLRKNRATKPIALKYSLRRSVAEMGPNGHPFEQLVGEIFRRKGYDVRVALMAKGWCVEHEIDVSARKEGTHALMECKFHNNHGIRSDLKTVLYVQARFEDIEKRQLQDDSEIDRFHEAWLASNTKFTENAIMYASCVGMRLLSWSYPHGEGLRDLMNETCVYPITVLTGLTGAQKQALMARGIVTCSQLSEQPSLIREIGIQEKKWVQVQNEIKMLCTEGGVALINGTGTNEKDILSA